MENRDDRKFVPSATVGAHVDVSSDSDVKGNDKGSEAHGLFIVEELEDSAKPAVTAEATGGASVSPATQATLGDDLNPPKEKIRRHSSYESPRLPQLPAARPSRKVSLAASLHTANVRRKEAYKYNHAPLSIATGTIEDDEADAQRIRRAQGIPFDEDFTRKNSKSSARGPCLTSVLALLSRILELNALWDLHGDTILCYVVLVQNIHNVYPLRRESAG
ncbi:uncharacterized protein LOC122255370 [Penaeus japonicus]|uniref:uncharacterized protein LOC122255370 n=1 Tax=Penaeus japonicus TaxID=27405 RepID=UPI001C70D3AB|nr:uncharacterized protein LOC122255370 [Penaeus japonicus]